MKLITTINGHLFNLIIPDAKSIILNGINADNIIFILESLLTCDYRYNWLEEQDTKYGFDYANLSEKSVLTFDTDRDNILGFNSIIEKNGNIPNIHCVRYVKNGIIRSYYFKNDDNVRHKNELNFNMSEYSKNVSNLVWSKIIETVNYFIGSKAVDLKNNKLEFSFVESDEFSIEAQKFIYLLISECFITPDNYERILLLSDIELLSTKQQVRLFNLLNNIRGHKLLVSSAKISYNEVYNDDIKFLNV